MDEALKKKINRAIKLIQAASREAAKIGQPVEVAYSGGKDNDVILALTKMADVPYRAIYKNTTIDPPYTIKHCKERGVEILHPKTTFAELIKKCGLPTRSYRFCCRHLKEYKVLDHAIIGVRREESAKRAKRYQEPQICRVYKKGEQARQYLPILDWTTADITAFAKLTGLTFHPHYYDEQGRFHPERRLGCLCCPLKSRRLVIKDFKTYPRMLRLYANMMGRYFATHTNVKNYKRFDGNVYKQLCFHIFCNGMEEYRLRFGKNLFCEVDHRALLQDYFQIELPDIKPLHL